MMVKIISPLVTLLACVVSIAAVPMASPAGRALSVPMTRDVTRSNTTISKPGFTTKTFTFPKMGVEDALITLAASSLAVVTNWQQLVGCSIDVCIFASTEALWFDWDSSYLPNSGIKAREVSPEGHTVYTLVHNSTVTVIHTEIMPIESHSTIRSMLDARTNASSWAHVFSRQYGNHSLVQVYHRRIDDAEVGDDNGRLHQLRAYHYTPENPKREEVETDGVVTDYLWNAGSSNVWSLIHDSESSEDLSISFAGSITDYMGDTDSIATCAIPGYICDNNTCNSGENHGVMAFGWNNQAFNFNGRAGAWVDGCHT